MQAGVRDCTSARRRCPPRRSGARADGDWTVQLIVLGFENPEFHGEIIAELESDTVRVIDALAVYKDAAARHTARRVSRRR
jgi:hypothetical protein